ncbi:hypothetical protein OKW27_004684 [Paraburkholderia sp. 35.1]
MFVTLRGEPYLLWRAVDEHGAELDVQVQKRRDKAAAKRFFRRVLRSNRCRARSLPTSCAAIRRRRLIFLSSLMEARFRQGGCTREQPCREQPSADPQARTPDVRLSRCASHAGIPLMLRTDTATLRVAQTSNGRGMVSCRTQRTLRHMAWFDCYCRSRGSYPIRITTLWLRRYLTPAKLTEPCQLIKAICGTSDVTVTDA